MNKGIKFLKYAFNLAKGYLRKPLTSGNMDDFSEAVKYGDVRPGDMIVFRMDDSNYSTKTGNFKGHDCSSGTFERYDIEQGPMNSPSVTKINPNEVYSWKHAFPLTTKRKFRKAYPRPLAQ